MHIILGIFALWAIIAYIEGIIAIPLVCLFFGAMIFVLIAGAIVVSRVKRTPQKLTAAQKQALDEAAAKDRENGKINDCRRTEANKKKSEECAAQIASLDNQRREKQAQMANRIAEMNALNVLDKKDWDLKLIDDLIEQLERRRADNIKEALREYDRKCAERDRRAYERFEQQLRWDEERQYRAEQERRHLEERWDRMAQQRQLDELKDLEKQRVAELERIRKDAEDARKAEEHRRFINGEY